MLQDIVEHMGVRDAAVLGFVVRIQTCMCICRSIVYSVTWLAVQHSPNAGDLAYSRGYECTWDVFFNQWEAVAGRMPWMVRHRHLAVHGTCGPTGSSPISIAPHTVMRA